jgi:hypothetical protein
MSDCDAVVEEQKLVYTKVELKTIRQEMGPIAFPEELLYVTCLIDIITITFSYLCLNSEAILQSLFVILVSLSHSLMLASLW